MKREVKSKGERERYTQLNEDFQRLERRDKKPFFKKKNSAKKRGKQQDMYSSTDPLKKIGDAKETFLTKMSTIKDRTARI